MELYTLNIEGVENTKLFNQGHHEVCNFMCNEYLMEWNP